MNPQENIITPAAVTPSPAPVQEPIKIGKFKASWKIIKESWNVLKQDKELAWFPVLSGITGLIAMAIFAAIFFFVFMGSDIHFFDEASEQQLDILGYAVLLIYYVVMFFIANYFLAGVYTIVHARFSGQNLSLRDGIANANKNIGKIFAWSLISATVGVILRIISDKSRIVGKIVAAIFGAAWAILTYFSLPSLIIGQKSIKESFKESAAVIRKTWGETIIVNFGVGLFFTLVTFFVLALSVGLVVLVPSTAMIVIVGTLFVIYIIAVSILSSTLGSIFKLALYEFASTGNVPQGFTPKLVMGAVKAGK